MEKYYTIRHVSSRRYWSGELKNLTHNIMEATIFSDNIMEATIFSEGERKEYLNKFVVPFGCSWLMLSKKKYTQIMVNKAKQKLLGGLV